MIGPQLWAETDSVLKDALGRVRDYRRGGVPRRGQDHALHREGGRRRDPVRHHPLTGIMLTIKVVVEVFNEIVIS